MIRLRPLRPLIRTSRTHAGWAPKRVLLALAATTIVALLLLASGPARSEANLQSLTLIDRTLRAIDRHYLDPDRVQPAKMLSSAIEEIEQMVPEILVTDKDQPHFTLTVGLASKRIAQRPMRTVSDLDRVLRETLTFIGKQYHGDVEFDDIVYAGIDGMLRMLDPHSNFLSPKVYKEFQVGTRGKFGGLGIVVTIKDGWLTVIAPLENTPAENAGIKAGDRIIQIGDESTINMSLTDAVNRLRGDVDTKITITIEREGKSPREVTLTRAVINIESVQHAILMHEDKRIGYLRVKSFQANTIADVRTALAAFHAEGKALDGMVLDMRNNPGGLLGVAVELTNHFLRKGTIVSTVGAHDRLLDRDVATAPGTEPDYPIVVLINEGSASASEIVAGALQADDRAIIMGGRSFGKGSVQTIFELGLDAALKLTIAQYKAAGTESIQLVGVTPDVEILPVVVDAKSMNLKRDVLTNESDLDEHLGNLRAKGNTPQAKSPFSVPHLTPKENDDDREARSIRDYAKKPKIDDDFMVTLARTLILNDGAGTRTAMLGRIAPSIETARQAQQQKIAAALKTFDIDWNVTPAAGTPKLSLSYRLLSGGKPVARARAGSTVEIELTATNTGAGPYSQLIGVGQSKETPFLSNREFPFGFIAPGKTQRWRTPIELPENLSRQTLTMPIDFDEAHGNIPEPIDVKIPIEAIDPPAFAFSYRLTGTKSNQTLATGKTIGLIADIANVGDGASSEETFATLGNDCGEKFFIETGRAKIGRIPPTGTRRTHFRFHLSPGLINPECKMTLTVADIKRITVLTDDIAISIPDGELTPPQKRSYQSPRITIVAAPAQTAATEAMLVGTIEGTFPIRDYFVFVGEKKIAYEPNAQRGTTMPISATIPLEKGNNRIIIGARNTHDLMSRKILVIERTEATTNKKTVPPVK